MNQIIFVCLFCSFCCYIDTKIRNSGSPTSSGPLNFFFLRGDYFMNVLIQSTQLAIFLVKMRWIERKKNPGMDEGQDTSFKGLLSYPCSTCTAEKAPVNTVSVRGCQVAKPQWWQHLRKFRMMVSGFLAWAADEMTGACTEVGENGEELKGRICFRYVCWVSFQNCCFWIDYWTS